MKNAVDVGYTRMLLFGEYDILMTHERIDKATLPEGIYCYDIRHSDSCWTSPITIEPRVAVNWYGTILSRVPVPLDSNLENPNDPYRSVSRTSFLKDSYMRLSEWIESEPLNKNDHKRLLAQNQRSRRGRKPRQPER